MENGSDLEGNEVRIFPVPAKRFLNISSKSQILELSLINIKGEKVLVQSPNQHNCQLDIRTIPEGLYLLKVRSVVGTQTLKVLIE
jgi:hypothetical protein